MEPHAQGSPTRLARVLGTLTDVNLAISGDGSPRVRLRQALRILTPLYGVLRASVVVQHPETGQLHIEVSSGLTPRGRQARWRAGEGITGRVVASGRPVVIPRISQEPLFLNRTDRPHPSPKPDATFISVPILGERKAIGALNVDLPFASDRAYEHDVELFRVVASMFAQALRVTDLAEHKRQRLLEENRHLKRALKERYDFSRIVGSSGPMQQVFEQVEQVATSNTTVLIRGESGTGKELIAHALHYNSGRANKPFIKVSCAALPDSLVESELFGHEKGAFTGAATQTKGRFERADGGTLFLDEIGDVTPATQVKLLRVVQAREFERLGGTRTVRTNARIITATNSELEKAIAAGTFREDLYYRLSVFTIFIPPLRERKADILSLSDSFLEKYASEHQKRVGKISTAAIDMLMAYHWPGNVRELENTIERAVLVCDGGTIRPRDLPPTLQTAEASGTVLDISLADAVSEYEKTLILAALKAAAGNQALAARLLNTTHRVVNHKVKKYGLDYRRQRSIQASTSDWRSTLTTAPVFTTP